MTPMTVAIAGAGGVLIYSAVHGYDPRDVVRSALTRGDWPPDVKYPIGDRPAGRNYSDPPNYNYGLPPGVTTPDPNKPGWDAGYNGNPTTDPPSHQVNV